MNAQKRPSRTIDDKFSPHEEKADKLRDEVKSFIKENGVSTYDLATCRSCKGDYLSGLSPLTGNECVPCYAERQGVIILDAPKAPNTDVHYVHDNNNPSFDNAVRLLEDY